MGALSSPSLMRRDLQIKLEIYAQITEKMQGVKK